VLFEPERHEPLRDAHWDAARARAAIQAIVDELERSIGPHGLWPPHPLDEVDGEPRRAFKTLYLGAAGVLWALWYLGREGAVTLRIDPSALIGGADAAYQREPDTDRVVASTLMGEVGVLLVCWRLTGSSSTAERLFAAIQRNSTSANTDAMWGAAGTIGAAQHMLAWTGEPRWRELIVASAEQIWRTWSYDERTGCHLWTDQLLGAGHGFAGCVDPLLRATSDPERREAILDRCVATLRATAVVDGDAVNWPIAIAAPRPGRPRMLVQWCHGAPGIVTALREISAPELEGLVIGAGTTIWNAGPLAKGYSLCHGTAGNGYAFLELHRRTGDPIWLARARAFAMHALGQREHEARGRYSLWTGDAGLAVYLWHCVIGAGALPGLALL
jgi:hypothetical protein